MFNKLESTQNDNTSGIGLGLSICKQIIDAFGGNIYIDDNYQEGTKITFCIECEINI